jgi:hypothetical protein
MHVHTCRLVTAFFPDRFRSCTTATASLQIDFSSWALIAHNFTPPGDFRRIKD